MTDDLGLLGLLILTTVLGVWRPRPPSDGSRPTWNTRSRPG
jgi:hypothetical protein